MPKKPEGVYKDKGGGWYLKVTVGRDPITGKRAQITRRGFATSKEAGTARRELLAKVDRAELRPLAGVMTMGELLDLYLDGLDADERLSAKTRYDYRHSTEDYIRPYLGHRKVRDVNPEMILAWQRKLGQEGGTKRKVGEDGKLQPGKGLSPNTIRLARAPLAGAFKLAMSMGVITTNPVVQVPRPKPKRSIPKHWSPEQARAVPRVDGRGAHVADLGVPPRFRAPYRRAGVAAVAERRSGGAAGQDRRVRLDPRLRPSAVDGKEPRRRPHHRSGRRTGQGARAPAPDPGRGPEDRQEYEESEYVFTKEDGGCYHPQRLSHLLGEYSKELGVPRLTAHGLRHTSATLMLATGVPPKVAAERLGHADASLFTNLYSHVTPTMQRDAADRIGEALFGNTTRRRTSRRQHRAVDVPPA